MVSLGVNHPMHPNSICDGYVLHVLRGDEDVLFAIRGFGGVDLESVRRELKTKLKVVPSRTHHHLHADSTVYGVHKYIKFV